MKNKYRIIRESYRLIFGVPNPLNAPFIVQDIDKVIVGAAPTQQIASEMIKADAKIYVSDDNGICYDWSIEKI